MPAPSRVTGAASSGGIRTPFGINLNGWGFIINALFETREDLQESKATYTVKAGGVTIRGVDVNYAEYVEGGTSKMEAQPFLYPAMRQVLRRKEVYFKAAKTKDEALRLMAEDVARIARQNCPVDTGRLKESIRVVKNG